MACLKCSDDVWLKKNVLISHLLLVITKDDECKYDHHHILFKSLLESFFASESSQRSKSACGTPARQISNHCFTLTCSFLLPLLFLFFCAPCLLWEHSNLLLLCTFSSSLSTPSPHPLSRLQHHHSSLGDNRYKEGLGSLVAAAQCASPLGKD